MDEITVNNFVALLEECVVNGDNGSSALYSWFCSERDLIDKTIKEYID